MKITEIKMIHGKLLTEWHNIVVWRHLAEKAERELKKGGLAFIEGKITHQKISG
jgi:single-stranded DNA-binding protein